jgi:hypothetical protein
MFPCGNLTGHAVLHHMDTSIVDSSMDQPCEKGLQDHVLAVDVILTQIGIMTIATLQLVCTQCDIERGANEQTPG